MKTKLYTFVFCFGKQGVFTQYPNNFKELKECMIAMEGFILDMHKHGLFPLTKVEILYEKL